MSASETKLWYLENNTWLKGLSKDEMMNIDKMSTMKSAKKGQYIYFPDEPSTSVFILKEGRVKVGTWNDDGKEIIKTILKPGEIFGELSLIGEDSRKDFAQAMDNEVMICAMGMADMESMMMKNPTLGFSITKLMGFRRRKMERRLNDLIFKDARERVIDFIKDMANDEGKKIGDEILIKHNLTHQDIANLTATSRQTVTLILNNLRDHDLIYMERKKILVRDIDKLK
jgi:CRP/FNR family transcriptional regulator, cyclic AMP receptor protein